ncbi:MAG: 3-oxoacyl-ACP synthase [Lutibacter sp.]|nr:MAG: 3-oxoacyl-ACP synthase [Lutibacter sp.]
MEKMNIKEILYKQCKEFVNTKLTTIENTIKSNQEALASETKSSAGDKHETGRAMLQLEMEKAGQQLQVVSEMKITLERINPQEGSSVCKLGSIIKTNTINYFIAISAGKLIVDETTYYAVSTKSPIGQLLIGKKENELIMFNEKQIVIKSIL